MKRFLSIILSLIMLVSLSAVSAFAAVTDASVEVADSSDLQIWDDIGYITGVTPKTSKGDFLAQLVPSNCELSLDCSSTYVGTGAVINLVSDDSTVIKSYTIVLYGDVNSDGELIWKTTFSYKDGFKSDLSEFDKDDNLKEKVIYTYENDLLVDESFYDGEGALFWKTIYAYNAAGKVDTIYDYNADGSLNNQKKFTYNEKGDIDTVDIYDSFSAKTTQEVFRYASNNTISEITTYDSDKKVIKRLILKYDDKNNITKVSEYNVAQKFGTTVNELVAMSDFSYEY